jgi:hypothetical protein
MFYYTSGRCFLGAAMLVTNVLLRVPADQKLIWRGLNDTSVRRLARRECINVGRKLAGYNYHNPIRILQIISACITKFSDCKAWTIHVLNCSSCNDERFEVTGAVVSKRRVAARAHYVLINSCRDSQPPHTP